MKAKVAAYITLYQDKEAALKCIEAISTQSTQVNAIFILDNSPVRLLEKYNEELITIHFAPSNLGIGAGLEMALAWAMERDYQFLWSFDQDSIPTENCLEILLQTYSSLSSDRYPIGIIGPTAMDRKNNEIIQAAVFAKTGFVAVPHQPESHFYECDSPITSGSLINLAAAKTVSPPRADLFIDGLDFDYGMRLKQKGFHNLIVPSAIMFHNFGNPIRVNYFNRQITFQQYSSLRHYYICRNHTYLDIFYSQGWDCYFSYLLRIKYLIFTAVKILWYDPESKLIKIWACLLGTYHGTIGKLGKTW